MDDLEDQVFFVCRFSIMIIGRVDSKRRDATRLPAYLNMKMEYLTCLTVNRFKLISQVIRFCNVVGTWRQSRPPTTFSSLLATVRARQQPPRDHEIQSILTPPCSVASRV